MFFPSCAIEPEDSNDVITIILVLEIHKLIFYGTIIAQ